MSKQKHVDASLTNLVTEASAADDSVADDQAAAEQAVPASLTRSILKPAGPRTTNTSHTGSVKAGASKRAYTPPTGIRHQRPKPSSDGWDNSRQPMPATDERFKQREQNQEQRGKERPNNGRQSQAQHLPRQSETRADDQARAMLKHTAPPRTASYAEPVLYQPSTPAPVVAAPVDENAPLRLSKLMAARGLCSRREADEYIENGWVLVEGEVVNTLGAKVLPSAKVELSPAARRTQDDRVTILLHKPIGYVSGQAEDGYEPAVVLIHADNQYIPENTQDMAFQQRHLRGLAPAGRLDIDSTGLLVLTQDGRVARHLIDAESTVEKEYLVRVEGHLSEDDLRLLNFGLSLDGVQLKRARVSWQNEDQLRFILVEGRKRQIRRMCELVGLRVVGLKRVRIGKVRLSDLPLGQWRYLRVDEQF